MLTDPRQRRFFKPKDIKDLFALGDDDEQGTETGDIFAGTGAREVKLGDVEAAKDGDNENDKEKNSDGGNASLLNSLLDEADKGALHSMINHDDIIGAGTNTGDAHLIEYEADRVAEDAFEEVKRSAEQRRRQGVAVPTWTGRSGLAGILGSSGAASGFGSKLPGSSKGSSLLQKIKAREGSSSMPTPNDGASIAGHRNDKKSLMENLIDFFKEHNGECTSNEVVNRFRERVEQSGEGVQVFKSMLKKIAKLTKGAGPNGESMWRLNQSARIE